MKCFAPEPSLLVFKHTILWFCSGQSDRITMTNIPQYLVLLLAHLYLDSSTCLAQVIQLSCLYFLFFIFFSLQVEMAEAVLPFLVHHMLLQGGAQTTVLSRHMCRFFAHCSRSFASPTSSVMNSFAQSDTQSTSFALHTLPGVSISSSHSSSGQSAVLPPTPSMKTMLDTLAFLRAQPKHMRSRYY